MILSEISIRRPVLATVFSLLIVLLGVISFDRLSVREYPKIDPPTVSVRTIYKGATAQVVESVITTPIEDVLSGIEGVDTIKSKSKEEVSEITVTFLTDRNVEAAANDVRDRVSRIQTLLPESADDPVVSKIEADAWPVLWLALKSDRHSPMELTDYADRYLTDPLKTLPGVATVIIGGERRYAMRVWIDREKLASRGLTIQDVETALRQQNLDSPGGRIESNDRELTVMTETDLKSPEAFNNMIIREISGYPIRIKDVGYAIPAPYENRKIVRISGEEALGLGVVKQSTGNTLALAQAVRDLLPQLISGLPEGMSMKVAFDTSQFISAAIDSVYKVLIEALILVVLVIFVFLRSVRATLIPIVTIPISLIGSFFFLYILGFSINVLTLLGIVLSVGLVVDDAIVMLENIHRHIEAGMNRFEAAMKGAREIGFAVVAMTITLVAVFTPLVFVTGRVGQLFVEFALTVVSAVLVSGFVALTLTPMMCSILLKKHENHGSIYKTSELIFEKINNGYSAVLRLFLKGWFVVVGVFVVAIIAMLSLFAQLKQELSPVEDRGFFMAFAIAPEGATMQYTDRYMKQVAGILGSDVPEIETLFEVVAPGLERPNPVNFAIGFAILEHWDTRKRSQLEISKQITPKLFGGIPGVISFAINPLSLGQSFTAKEIEYVIYGNSYEELQNHVDTVMAKLRAYPGITGLDTDLKLNKPQLRVNVDREKAASMGISMATIGTTVETLLGGRDVTRYKREGKQYDVVLQMEDAKRRQPTDLTSIYVRARSGQLVQLSNLVSIEETVTPKELNHFNRFRAAIISGNVGPEASQGEVLDFIDSIVAAELPKNVTTDLNGSSREYRDSGDEMKVTLVLALIFIYLVLAAQFESFIGPFVIMLTVPLGFLGAILVMWLNANLGDGGSLNVYSRIGLVMLVGLITKNGILIVEFANQLRRAGQEKIEAVLEASTLRLRPILMTALATVLGALPLALSTGAGAEARRAIGWVIVGGVSVGTLLTLFIIPVAYSLIVRTTPRVRDGT
ncbi:MAG: efflux RND transporter permease subunit [Proteobacteria bacterium]|nr:efflux RND transporter permease subunit [Pseudomonadota bacterium]MDA0861453.1 efflux RND transporter permease subunit [Pseudomonadota bacterium]MDA1031008.1 efflux RND transporter permease subunit [Pseudomonadota bacterium]